MIERVVASLGANGVTDAVLSLGYKPDAFMKAYPDGTCAGVTLHYAVEPEPLDTAGAVRFAALDAGIDDRFIVVNGDVLSDVDVAAIWAFHDKQGAEGTISLTPVDDPSRYGVVPIDADGRVEAFIEKPPAGEAPTNWINAGTYVLEPSVIDRIPEGRKVSIERETFPAMVAAGTLFALQSDEYWVDSGTPATYLQVQLDLVNGVRAREVAVSPSAVVAADAEIVDSVVMQDVRIGAGATVEGSAVLPGARIGARARIVGSIVGPAAVIGDGAVLDELTVIGDGVSIDAGASLHGARVPENVTA